MKNLIRAALVLISAYGLSFSSQVFAAPGYEELPNAPKRADTERVEVVEYFWFGCPHCFAFEPSINKWADEKPDYVDFVREAPPLNPGWEPHSRAFYAAEIMGVTDKFFDPIFDGIHVERRSLRQPDKIAKFAGELGIDEDKFRKTMDSFAVNTRMKQAMQMAQASRIRGVPSVVINGKYLKGGSLAGSHDGIIRVINERVAEEYALL